MDEPDVQVSYCEQAGHRQLRIASDAGAIDLLQPTTGYGMIVVSTVPDGTELERYYGLDMAIDHAADYLDIPVRAIAIPDAAKSMGI